MTDLLAHAIAVNLFWIVLTGALVAALIGPAEDCWLPATAPTRGFYESCWGFWDIWT